MSDENYTQRIIDEEAIAGYLEEELGPAESFSIELLKEGHSNETRFVTWGNRELVLRRPPPGDTASTAHDVIREYRIMDALQATDVCVPTTVAVCEDSSVLDCEFYLMERERGDVIRESEPSRFASPEQRERLGYELVDRLIAVHDVDFEAVGLSDFGRPEGYLERQVDRWRKQFSWAFKVTSAARSIPDVETVGDWLAENTPKTQTHSIVHGDYKTDNVMFGPETPPRIVGIFDWEMSTLGDPRADLGWLLLYWHETTDPEPAIPELIPTFTEAEGYPTRRQLVDRYETQSGIEFEHGRFYTVLAMYKLGAICEMFFRRYLERNAENPIYPNMRERVPTLIERARRTMEGDLPL
jgi:aminoglycoside phosphotransferase (APT) family kinase protein